MVTKLTILILSLSSLISCVSSPGSHSDDVAKPLVGEDPLATYAWHLENTAQTTFANNVGKAGEDLSIKNVHESGVKGLGIKIAISDSGVEVAHPDLTENQLSTQHRDYSQTYAYQWANGNPYPIEYEAHGTAVTGLVAASGWNAVGSRGVAPLAKYAGFLFIGNFHTYDASYEAKVLDQMTGSFDIFNYSYGYLGCDFYPAASDVIAAYQAGVTNLRSGKGAIYVKAAGNDFIGDNEECDPADLTSYLGNTNTDEEQNTPYVILTAAVNAKGKISSYSTPGSGLWISSAGGEYGTSNPAMLTTDITTCSQGFSRTNSTASAFNKGQVASNARCDYTSVMNGSSAATPVLSGIIALMLEANPNLSWRDVKHILAVTADKINYSTAVLAHPDGSGSELSGHIYDYLYVRNAAGVDYSNTYGFGRVNANNAVNMAKTYVSALGSYLESSYLDSGTINLSIPDKSVVGVTHTLNVSQNYSLESVQIQLSTDHTKIGDLAVELTSPAGTKSKILLLNSNISHNGLSDYTLLTNAFYQESSIGPWTLKVLDGKTLDTGKIISWKIKVSGHTP